MDTACLENMAGNPEVVAGRPLIVCRHPVKVVCRPLMLVLSYSNREQTKHKQSILKECLSTLPLLISKQVKGGVGLIRKPSIDAISLHDDL
ncbi:hypothetical protein CsSME_00001337 [Camellia sinensis var. sinensis]